MEKQENIVGKYQGLSAERIMGISKKAGMSVEEVLARRRAMAFLIESGYGFAKDGIDIDGQPQRMLEGSLQSKEIAQQQDVIGKSVENWKTKPANYFNKKAKPFNVFDAEAME